MEQVCCGVFGIRYRSGTSVKKLVMYVYILDYLTGDLHIDQVPAGTDIEDYVDDKYGLSNTEYMTTEKLNINVTTI